MKFAFHLKFTEITVLDSSRALLLKFISLLIFLFINYKYMSQNMKPILTLNFMKKAF